MAVFPVARSFRRLHFYCLNPLPKRIFFYFNKLPEKTYPALQYIDTETPITELRHYLQQMGWLDKGETITATERPGAGNMNVVLRVRTDRRSFILKQSRPFVQKFPQIPAPLERLDVEHRFYQAVADESIREYLPEVLAYDPQEYLLMLEDLGQGEDMTAAYTDRRISTPDVDKLIGILSVIHRQKVPAGFPPNLELRQLNHQHIFVLPFLEDNGFQLDDIQPGLQALSLPYKKDNPLKQKIEALGEKYLSTGDTLLHGDYYPGSWMKADDALYVLDPEFSHSGFAEFDLGVMAAHLILISGAEDWPERILDRYTEKADPTLTRQIAGTEIMRRVIGLAQLPLPRSLEEKKALLQLAHQMILS